MKKKNGRSISGNRKRRQRLLRRLRDKSPHMKYVYGFFYKHARIKKKTVLIESFHGKTIGDSGLVFAKEILSSYPSEYRVYYASNNIEEHKSLIKQFGLDVELIDIETFRYCEILASAEYIISNASLPVYYIRKKGQTYLQTWHGTPLKTLGKKMREGIESMHNVQHNFLQASYITFPNEFTRRVIMEDYNLERLYTGNVVMAGYPRNSVFLSGGRSAEIREQLGTSDAKVYAYMPTWRGRSNHDISGTDYLNTVSSIFKKLDACMRDDQIMYVNFHPIVKSSFDFGGYKHIKPFPAGIDSYEFLNSVDALVTDYSSVFFDFSLTKKPVLLFMYDYDEYMAERGMYMDVADLPFRKIRDVGEFCECISEDSCLEDNYENSEYFRDFFRYDSPNCAKELLELLFHGDPGELEIESYKRNGEKPVNVYAPEVRTNDEAVFRTLARVASGPDDVVLLYYDWFKYGIGQLLYDNYNDKFDYLITTDAPPRTYFEQIMAKTGSKKYRKMIKARDKERMLPGLDIGGGFIKNYGLTEIGYQADISSAGIIDSEVSAKKCGVTVSIRVIPESIPDGLELKQAVILDNNNTLISERDLSREELESLEIAFDMKDIIESLAVYQDESATPALLAADRDGNRVLLLFGDFKKTSEEKDAAKKSGKEGALSYTVSNITCSLPADYERKNLRLILNSHDEYVRSSVSSYKLEPVSTEMSVIPHLSFLRPGGIIRLHVSKREHIADFISEKAILKGFHFDSKGVTVRALAKSWKAENVSGAVLILDSAAEDAVIPLEVRATDVAEGCMAELRLELYEGIPLVPLRWHCMLEIDTGEEKIRLEIRIAKALHVAMLKLGMAQSLPGNGYVLFPYIGRGDIFKLYYRQVSKYDGADTRRRELAALFLLHILGPYYRRKKLFVIYEKFCLTAQDNSYYFFKYCMDNLKGKERDRVYYVIDKESADYEKVKGYGKQVIGFMTVKHMVYAMAAKQCISTDSSNHLYAWQSKPSYVYDRIHGQGILFLQHGVTALKRVDQLYGKKGSSPMRFVVTTSDTEQQIFVKEFGYRQSDAPVVGFARWDVLEDKKKDADKFILIMPTWRQWLEAVDDETFMDSDYYRKYTGLIMDPRLDEILRANEVRLVLYMHPKFADYIKVFQDRLSGRIECVAFGERPLNDIMMKCHMLITDYSSVCWDVLFMDKPVIFYHFDSDKYLKVHGSYINFETDLPGPREMDHEGVLEQIEYYINNGFAIRREHEEMIPKFFKYRDSSNCERTYKFLKDRV